jgi:mRNA-degrading endonuclease RelE of RelBE toxin-antitoxin system
MTWNVHIHDNAAKQLKALPPDRRQRVLDDIAVFEEDPFRGLVKPLKGNNHRGHYRKSSGRYRIILSRFTLRA